MPKSILITGSTDGIGLLTAKKLVQQGHHVLLHGRNKQKLHKVHQEINNLGYSGSVEEHAADLSVLSQVTALAKRIKEQHSSLDVLINNAGIFKTDHTRTNDGLDVRFAVNTIAPYLLTNELIPILGPHSRVVNLSSAAQATVRSDALLGQRSLESNQAYAQSKLGIVMWSNHLSHQLHGKPLIVSVNPGSFLGTKMVKEGYGMSGHSVDIGADILIKAALSNDFNGANGKYFDNDAGSFRNPHGDALDKRKCSDVTNLIEEIIKSKL